MLCFHKRDWAPIRHTPMGYQGEDCNLPEITQAAVVGCQFRLVRNQWLLLQPTEGLWDLNTMLRCWKSCLTNVISQSKPASLLPENFLTCQVSFFFFHTVYVDHIFPPPSTPARTFPVFCQCPPWPQTPEIQQSEQTIKMWHPFSFIPSLPPSLPPSPLSRSSYFFLGLTWIFCKVRRQWVAIAPFSSSQFLYLIHPEIFLLLKDWSLSAIIGISFFSLQST